MGDNISLALRTVPVYGEYNQTGVMPVKFWGGHSLKRCAPNYLLHENRTLYHQHTPIITEVHVKLNKWHITTETEQSF